MSETKTKIFASAIGRRKRSIARVRLVAGDGAIVINGKKPTEYFGANQDITRLSKPFTTLGLDKYDVSALIAGGGTTGQLDALVLGIARAVASLKKDNKAAMRTADLLTRDPRKRQRRMIGTGGKARRKKQSPKR